MIAYEFLARDRAGLTFTGFDEKGHPEWIGTIQQWNKVNKEEMKLIWR